MISGYELVDDVMSWPNAEQYCVDRGGHLASITSQEENDLLLQLATSRWSVRVHLPDIPNKSFKQITFSV